MIERYILDACALIALLTNEAGSDIVSDILNRAHNDIRNVKVFMNKLNLLEVYYDAYRSAGKDAADNMLGIIEELPIRVIPKIGDDVFREAGRLKASYRVSIADAIALAEGLVVDAMILTSDHHEFDVIERNENIRFCWIR